MAFTATMEWEVDAATGNNANGGGFDSVAGTPGTNYAWGAGQATYAYTDIVIGSAGNETKGTSATRAFGAADVGNVLNVTSGTGFTVQRVQILSVTGTTATFDKSLGTAASTGGTGTLGGSLATVQVGLDLSNVIGITVWIKSGTYASAAALTTANFPASNFYSLNRVVGYYATHGDDCAGQARPIIRTSAATNGITNTKDGMSLENLDFDGDLTGLIGISSVTTYHSFVYNCLLRDWITSGGKGASCDWHLCEITGCTGTYAHENAFGSLVGCYSHDNAGNGFYGMTYGGYCTFFSFCISESNTGANGNGFLGAYGIPAMQNCIAYNNAQSGVREVNYSMSAQVFGCIFASNGAYGINRVTTTPQRADRRFHHNAFYANTSGLINTAGTDNVLGIGDVNLGSDAGNIPFTDAPNGDFSLNTGAAAGALLRALGFPGTFPGGLSVGKTDIGAVQHADPAGGGGVYIAARRNQLIGR